jgi:hypothetical protein
MDQPSHRQLCAHRSRRAAAGGGRGRRTGTCLLRSHPFGTRTARRRPKDWYAVVAAGRVMSLWRLPE